MISWFILGYLFVGFVFLHFHPLTLEEIEAQFRKDYPLETANAEKTAPLRVYVQGAMVLCWLPLFILGYHR